MNAKPHFGVLESAWEMEVPRQPNDEGADESLSFQSDTPDLPFTAYLLPSVPSDVIVEHCEISSVLVQKVPGDAGHLAVQVVELITRYLHQDGRAIILTQYEPPEDNVVVYRAAAGMSRQVAVGTTNGLLIQGQWRDDGNSGKAYWSPTGAATVLWMIGSRAFTLSGVQFTADEVMTIAESIDVAT